MKKINYFLVMLASLALVTVSCNKEKESTASNEGIVLTVSGGAENIEVLADVEKDVIITASKELVAPIEVSLTLNNTNGDAVLGSTTVSMAAGQKEAKTTIKFPLDKWPANRAQEEIVVTAAADDTNVTFEPNKTSYFPYGEGGNILVTELTVTATPASPVNTATGASVTLTYSLNKKMATDLTIKQTTGTGEGVIDPSLVTWDKTSYVIAAGEKSTTAKVSVPVKAEGKLPLTFAIENEDVTLKTSSLEIVFEYIFPGEPVALCVPEFGYANYTITKTFTFGDYTLTPEHTLDGAGYGLIDMTNSVTANVSNGDLVSVQCQNVRSGSSDVYAVVAFVDWNRDGKLTADERLFLKDWTAGDNAQLSPVYNETFQAPEGITEGRYYARIGQYFKQNTTFGNGGCGKVESGDLIDIAINFSEEQGALKANLAADGATKLTAAGTITRNFTVRLNRQAENPVTINLTVEGKAELSASSLTIATGETLATGSISFKQEDFPISGGQQTVKLAAASGDAEFGANNTIEYTVKPLPESGLLDTYCVIGGEGYAYASISKVEVNNVSIERSWSDDSNIYNRYYDLAEEYTANIKAGDVVKVTFLNNAQQSDPYGKACGIGDPFEAVVYIDWNQDGDFADTGEKFRKTFEVNCGFNETQIVEIGISTIPADAMKKSTMRILTHYLGSPTQDGCQNIESGNVFDIAYQL